MTLEERVTRLEEHALGGLEADIRGLRADFNTFRSEQGAILGRILGTLERIEQRPGFHWPWEGRA